MSLQPGTRLGSYEVTALIGQGGMGEVYRAHDTKQRAGGAGNVSRRVGFGVAVACLSILSVLDAPVSGQSARPAADEQATVRLEGSSTEPSTDVVVLPFANISGDPRDEWIGAGIAATLETELQQVSGVQVISRASLGAGSEPRGAARSRP